MTLTAIERLLLLTILPREGNIATLKIVSNLRANLSFSEEDHARLEMKTEGDRVIWNPNVPQESEVEIGPTAFVLIQETLKKLNKDQKLTEDFLSVWDKFSPEGE